MTLQQEAAQLGLTLAVIVVGCTVFYLVAAGIANAVEKWREKRGR